MSSMIREYVTPERAARFLESQGQNFRKLDLRAVQKIARDMVEGRYVDNGETMKFNERGEMFDGQHRAAAIVESGMGQWLWLCFVEDSVAAVHTVDIGRPRHTADSLRNLGFADARSLQGALNLFWNWRHNSFDRNVTPSQRELLDLVDEHPGLADALQATNGFRGRPLFLQPSAATVAIYAFSSIDTHFAARFFDTLNTGTGLMSKTDPIFALRRLLEQTPARTKRKNFEQLALLIKTWNDAREGRSRGNLAWRRDEAFPELPGWQW